MTTKGLPGIEALFREKTRLARKLSLDELTALRRYIGGRVTQEHEGLLFKIRHLTAALELSEIEYQDTLGAIQTELDCEKWAAKEFQREFCSLTQILKQRDERFRLKHETMVSEQKKARLALRTIEDVNRRLNNDIHRKEDAVEHLEIKANQLRNKHRRKVESLEEKHSEEKSSFQKEILKIKYELHLKNKEISNLKADLYESKQKSVKFKDTECSNRACAARDDLLQCRAQLVEKCQEVTALKFQVEQRNRRIQEQAKLLNYFSPALQERKDYRQKPNRNCENRRNKVLSIGQKNPTRG